MRANWEGNTELQRRVLSTPPGARHIVEVLRSLRSDIKDEPADWQARDLGSNVTLLADGGAKLLAVPITRAEFAVGAANVLTTMRKPQDPPVHVLQIDWTAPGASDFEIRRFVARLHPNADEESGVEAEEWICRLLRLDEISRPAQRERWFDFQPIRTPIRVPVVGSTPSDVEFIVGPVKVGPRPLVRDAEVDFPENPVTIAVIYGVKDQGELAGNTAWVGDDSQQSHTGDGFKASRRVYDRVEVELESSIGTRFIQLPESGGIPRFELISGAYTQDVISFTATANRLNLLSVPEEELEVVARGEEPLGTSLTYELKEPAEATWFEVADGDLIGVDNTPTGGNDLSGLPKRPDYDARVTLTPNAAGSSSPIVRRLGVDDRASEILDGEATLQGASWSLDPTWIRGEVGEVGINLLRTGIRDYRDPATEILTANHLGELEVRIWLGHPDLARRHWLHIDSYLVEDYEASKASIELRCVQVLAKLKHTIPPWDPVTRIRAPLVYENATLKEVWDDLLKGQIALPGRAIGPGVMDNETLVTKRITESTVKDELDAIAFLAGGGVISSQGRIKFVRVFQDVIDSEFVIVE